MPRVAIITGNIAGRGLSIQNAKIDFVCTSFCFVDTKNVAQCGAQNIQRFGRACGMLKNNFKNPIIIATNTIMMEALANQQLLAMKALNMTDGELIALKDFVSKEEWERIKASVCEKENKTTKPIQTAKPINSQQTLKLFDIYFKQLSLNGTKTFTLKDIKSHVDAGAMWTTNHNRNHSELMHKKYIEGGVKVGYTISQIGKDQFKKNE